MAALLHTVSVYVNCDSVNYVEKYLYVGVLIAKRMCRHIDHGITVSAVYVWRPVCSIISPCI